MAEAVAEIPQAPSVVESSSSTGAESSGTPMSKEIIPFTKTGLESFEQKILNLPSEDVNTKAPESVTIEGALKHIASGEAFDPRQEYAKLIPEKAASGNVNRDMDAQGIKEAQATDATAFSDETKSSFQQNGKITEAQLNKIIRDRSNIPDPELRHALIQSDIDRLQTPQDTIAKTDASDAKNAETINESQSSSSSSESVNKEAVYKSPTEATNLQGQNLEQQNSEQLDTKQSQQEVSAQDNLTTWEQKLANKQSLTLDETRELIKAKNDPNLDPEQQKRMQKALDNQFTLSWNELAKQINEAQKNNPLFSQFPPEQQAKQMKQFMDKMDVIMKKVANGEELTEEEGRVYKNAETLLGGASAEVTTKNNEETQEQNPQAAENTNQLNNNIQEQNTDKQNQPETLQQEKKTYAQLMQEARQIVGDIPKTNFKDVIKEKPKSEEQKADYKLYSDILAQKLYDAQQIGIELTNEKIMEQLAQRSFEEFNVIKAVDATKAHAQLVTDIKKEIAESQEKIDKLPEDKRKKIRKVVPEIIKYMLSDKDKKAIWLIIVEILESIGMAAAIEVLNTTGTK